MEIEVTAKKVEDAINQGLIQLGATLDEVNVEVLNAGGLFHKARVKLTLEREQPKAHEQADKEQAKEPLKEQAKEQPKEQVKPQVAQPITAKKNEKKSEPSSKNADAPLAAQQQKEQSDQRSASEKGDSEQNLRQKSGKKQKGQSAQGPRRVDRKQQEQGECDGSQETGDRREENKAAQARAHEFVKNVVQRMGFSDVSYDISDDGETISVTAPAGDDSLIIGRHGETLSALAYLAETSVRAEKCRVNVTVDCNGYRDKRAASLTAMARRRADECVAKRRKIKLEPMERIDRRTVHSALNDDKRVSTASEGKEPYRYIVIIPQKRGE